MKRTAILFLLPLIAFSSCVSVPEGFGIDHPEQYSRIYIAASYNGIHNEELQAPKPTEVSIWANYSGVVSLGYDLNVQMGAELDKVDTYNERQGTHYAPMDENYFTLKVSQVTIAAGTTLSSSPAIVEFHSEKFLDEQIYLLPVSIVGCSNESIAFSKDLSTLYIAVRCKAGVIEIISDELSDFEVSPTENW